MKTPAKIVILTGLLVSLSASAANQFCVVDNWGNRRNCHFSLAACQNNAHYVQNAACVLMQDQAPARIDPAQDIINKFTEARERRREQEERQARMDLMYAQQRQIEQQSAYQAQQQAATPYCEAPAPSAVSVAYRCPLGNGSEFYSTTPAVGCVVISVN